MITKQQFKDAIDQTNARFDWFTETVTGLRKTIKELESVISDAKKVEKTVEEIESVLSKQAQDKLAELRAEGGDFK